MTRENSSEAVEPRGMAATANGPALPLAVQAAEAMPRRSVRTLTLRF